MDNYQEVHEKIRQSKKLNEETKDIMNLLLMMFRSLSEERTQEMIRLDQRLENAEAEISTKIETNLKPLHDQLNNAFSTMEARVVTLEEKIVATELEVVEANKEVAQLRTELNKVQKFADDQDAYTRRESLIFSGDSIPPAGENENCPQTVRKIIRDTLKLSFEPLISTAHRLGKPPSPNAPDRRDLIAKFVIRDQKHKVYSEARIKKIAGLYVNESLTPVRKSISFALRNMKKSADLNGLVTGTTTHNGRVFVFHKPSRTAPKEARNLKTEINSMEQLSSFCVGFLQEPLSKFLPDGR